MLADFLLRLSEVLKEFSFRLREVKHKTQYYVFAPLRSKPRVKHFNFSSAKHEAERIVKDCATWEWVEVLQIVDSVSGTNTDIPF